MYSTMKKNNGTVTFSDAKSLPASLDYIRAPLGLVFLFERSMGRLEETMLKVAGLQHRLNPI